MILSTLQTAGLLVGIFYYILTLRNAQHTRELALKNQELTLQSQELSRKAQEQAADTRKAQLVMQFLEKTSRPDMIESRIKYDKFEWVTANDYIQDISSFDGLNTLNGTLGYYEGIGVLVKEGLLDIRPITLLSSGIIRSMWEKFDPIKYEVRKELEWPRLFIECEYLYYEIMKFHKEHPEITM